MELTFRPAIEFTYAQLAQIFNLGFEGYFVPIELSAAILERICRTESSDLSSGLIALHNQVPVGLLLLARRGHSSRIHAMGVAPQARGLGVGKAMLNQCIAMARERNDQQIKLEVITANETAKKLYLGHGFRVVQPLTGFVRSARDDSQLSALPLGFASPLEFANLVRQESVAALPWQLSPETLGLQTAPTQVVCLENKAYAMLGDTSGAQVALRALIVPRALQRQGWGSKLLNSLFATYPNRTWNMGPIVPEGLMNAFLDQHGFTTMAISQLEMQLDLNQAIMV